MRPRGNMPPVPMSMCRGRPLRGLTLIELLVVIAIIGMLMAITLPAVQSVREATRLVECGNNERQVALAILGYHEAHRRFPSQYGWSSGRAGVGACGTLFFHILPFLEEMPLFESARVPDFAGIKRRVISISGSGPYTEYANTFDSRNRILRQFIDMYQCPSEPSAGYVRESFGWRGASYGSNFQVFGNASSVVIWMWRNTAVQQSVEIWQGRRGLEDITDGSSKTVAIAEKFGTCNSVRRGPVRGGTMWSRWDWLDTWHPTFAADSSFQQAKSMFQDNPLPYMYPGPWTAAVITCGGRSLRRDLPAGQCGGRGPDGCQGLPILQIVKLV